MEHEIQKYQQKREKRKNFEETFTTEKKAPAMAKTKFALDFDNSDDQKDLKKSKKIVKNTPTPTKEVAHLADPNVSTWATIVASAPKPKPKVKQMKQVKPMSVLDPKPSVKPESEHMDKITKYVQNASSVSCPAPRVQQQRKAWADYSSSEEEDDVTSDIESVW